MARRKVEPPTEPVSTQAYRDAIDTLISIYRSGERITVGRAKRHRIQALHGLIAYTIEQVQAALALIDAGLTSPAAVNTRVAMEYALTVQWVHLTDEGIEKFVAKTSKSTRVMYEASKKAGLAIPDDIRDAFDEDKQYPPVDPILNNFEQLCEQFDDTGWQYLVYRSLSGYVHPSSAVAVSYLDTRREPPALIFHADHDPRPLTFTLAMATALVVAVHDDHVRTKPNKAKIRDAAAAVGLPVFLALTDKARAKRAASRATTVKPAPTKPSR